MSVTAAKGFLACGVRSGMKTEGLDLALVRSLKPAVGAAMFTQNRVQAAPVTVSRRHLEQAQPQAIVLNSGCANAATGECGELDALATAAEAARLLELSSEQILLCSTGVIGVRLPLDKLVAGLALAAPALSEAGGDDAARAIMTTDTRPKQAVATGTGFSVGGMAKGAAMIHPQLATMLAVITTDYPLGPGEPEKFLRPAVEHSFNRISVDGDCSTNDTVILLANGAAEVSRSEATDRAFEELLGQVCHDLAEQIVKDAEGATVLVEVNVRGAVDEGQAVAIAARIASSPLVKTAVFGHDPNWGRVMMAAGSAAWNGDYAELDPGKVTLAFNGTQVLVDGAHIEVTPPMEGVSCVIDLDLGLGEGEASYLASDLSYEYVRLNAEYTT
ncbi:MAG TPA: bifunctional glutamate N-acetyltransferase/amino-acid acetyltransferase ArgJ [Gaiellaceae bacterium]|jgi:glutamate N-acetyltransferase / amino-acid N-acetyltransferase